MLLSLKMDDRAYWMYKVLRVEPLYLDKVEIFLEAAQKDARNKQLAEINCPCCDCKNLMLFQLAQLSAVRGHLLRRGFTGIIHVGQGTDGPTRVSRIFWFY